MILVPKKLKYMADHISRGDAPSYVDESNFLVINQACVSPKGVALDKVKFHDPADVARITAWLQDGDVLVNSTGTGTLGRVAWVNGIQIKKFFADGHITIIRDSKQRFNPRFLFYLLSSQQEQITIECADGATNQIELNRSKLGNKVFKWPNLEYQRRIANFLDFQVSGIDGLVDAKQRLLGLLGEKRKAIFDAAAEFGLNSNRRLHKYSEPWGWQMPMEWKLQPLRRLILSLEQGWSPIASNAPSNDQEPGVLKLSAIKAGRFLPTENKALLPGDKLPKELAISAGDVFITRANTPNLVGDVAMAEADYPTLLFSDLIYRVRVRAEAIMPEWLVLVLMSKIGRSQIESEAKGSSGSMVKLSQDQVLGLLVPVPPYAEQVALVEEVRRETGLIASLIDQTLMTINLLQERRAVLIARAVATGGCCI